MSRSSLMSLARTVFWFTAAGLLLVVPWLFGGMSEFAYYWIINSGWICAGCLAIWLWNCGKLHPGPTKGFWIALVCWSLLSLQIWLSIRNPSHSMRSPWTTSYFTFDPIAHNEWLPRTAFWGASRSEGHFYRALGLIALTGYALGIEKHLFRRLLALFVFNAAVLAAVGVPFKFSGERLILGRWEFSEWYFYSTFYYHNHWAAFVLLAMAAAMALFVSFRGKATRALLVSAVALMFVSIVVAKARLGVLASIVLLGCFALFLIRNKIVKPSKTVIGWVLGTTILTTIATLMIYSGSTPQMRDGGARSWEGLMQQNPVTTRLFILLDTLPMIAEKPAFGWGLGGYGASFQKFQRPETISIHNGVETRYSYPHNDWLQWITEIGLIGTTLLLFPVIQWLRQAQCGLVTGVWPVPILLGGCAVLLFACGDMAFVNKAVFTCFVLLVSVSCHGFTKSVSSRIGPFVDQKNRKKA